MAAQCLPRDLVWPSSGKQKLDQMTKKKTSAMKVLFITSTHTTKQSEEQKPILIQVDWCYTVC